MGNSRLRHGGTVFSIQSSHIDVEFDDFENSIDDLSEENWQLRTMIIDLLLELEQQKEAAGLRSVSRCALV